MTAYEQAIRLLAAGRLVALVPVHIDGEPNLWTCAGPPLPAAIPLLKTDPSLGAILLCHDAAVNARQEGGCEVTV